MWCALKNRQHLTPQILDLKIGVIKFWKLWKLVSYIDFEIEDSGSNVADFWARTTCRSILLDLLLVEISRTWGPSKRSAKKIWENEKFSLKNLKNWYFSILGGQNRLPEGWGGAAQLWVGKKLFSSNQPKITQTEISDRAHPHHQKNHTSKSAVLMLFFEKKWQITFL